MLFAAFPFVAMAVLPFQAILQLEFNRRANDGCMLALISLMSDMIQPLSQLPDEKFGKSCAITLDSILAKMKMGVMLIRGFHYGAKLCAKFFTNLCANLF